MTLLAQPDMPNPKWPSGTIAVGDSGLTLQLDAMRSVVGGEFRAILSGQQLALSRNVQVTMSCVGFETESYSRNLRSSSPTSYFLEVEQYHNPGSEVEIRFLIPFEARSTDENATWQLLIELEDKTCEIVEVPVFRTAESNPEINEVSIASFGFNSDDASLRDRNNAVAQHGQRRQRRFEVNQNENTLSLTIPLHTPGKPSFAKGLGAFAGIWAAATVLCGCIFLEDALEPLIILGLPLLAMTALLVFVLFGESRILLDETSIICRNHIFGISFPKRIPRSDIAGFKASCIGSLPCSGTSQPMYIVMAKKQDSANVLLSMGMLNQNDSRSLAKRLNDFWSVDG